MPFWLIVLLWILWTVLCITIGVLLSRRLITTSTEFYAALYHSERAAVGELQFIKAKIAAKVKAAEEAVENQAKKIVTPN